MTEKELQAYVLEAATLLGWRAYHTFDSRRSQAGFPDLVLLRPPRLIFAELKSETGRLSRDQAQWVNALREVEQTIEYALGMPRPGPLRVLVWRPAQWESGEIAAALR